MSNNILQLLANVATQLLVLDLCMSFGFTTIVIAALMDDGHVEGSDELRINSYEASWLGNAVMKWRESRGVDQVMMSHGVVIMSLTGG
jgi:hypothetical protein